MDAREKGKQNKHPHRDFIVSWGNLSFLPLLKKLFYLQV